MIEFLPEVLVMAAEGFSDEVIDFVVCSLGCEVNCCKNKRNILKKFLTSYLVVAVQNDLNQKVTKCVRKRGSGISSDEFDVISGRPLLTFESAVFCLFLDSLTKEFEK